jgi:hypothetical protein
LKKVIFSLNGLEKLKEIILLKNGLVLSFSENLVTAGSESLKTLCAIRFQTNKHLWMFIGLYFEEYVGEDRNFIMGTVIV